MEHEKPPKSQISQGQEKISDCVSVPTRMICKERLRRLTLKNTIDRDFQSQLSSKKSQIFNNYCNLCNFIEKSTCLTVYHKFKYFFWKTQEQSQFKNISAGLEQCEEEDVCLDLFQKRVWFVARTIMPFWILFLSAGFVWISFRRSSYTYLLQERHKKKTGVERWNIFKVVIEEILFLRCVFE